MPHVALTRRIRTLTMLARTALTSEQRAVYAARIELARRYQCRAFAVLRSAA